MADSAAKANSEGLISGKADIRTTYPLLDCINSPWDVKKLFSDELPLLCKEIRREMIYTVSKNGGHLASNLGVVELTVALHRVFDSPEDAIIFDVGHQCYTHKLLTGRRSRFNTLRTENGISGFMRPSESEHDPFITGHSSNSISAAFGIARAKSLKSEPGRAVAVVGDGAMTGGMIFEALNNAGRCKDNMIVILNDNKMSISRNVGALAKHLATIRSQPTYFKFKRFVERNVVKLPVIGDKLNNSLVHSKNLVKNAIYHANMFEDMGFHYLGPVDGHDLELLSSVLKLAKQENRPVLVHVCTIKGKGYSHAEKNPGHFHGVPAFDVSTGHYKNNSANFSSEFGRILCNYAEKDSTICGVSAAMATATGLDEFYEKYPSRFFDVGIAEEHAVTFSAGLASKGMHPVFAVYSSFLQRGYDQLIHDAAIDSLPLTLAVDRAGIVGEDGETHQGLFDAAFLTTIPGVSVYSPSNYADLEIAMEKAIYAENGVSAVRYPRGGEPLLPADYAASSEPYTIYGDINADTAIITYGRIFSEACNARLKLHQKRIDTAIVKLNRITGFMPEMINSLCGYKKIYFFEEGIKSGGIGQQLASVLLENGYHGKYVLTAIPDVFVSQSTVAAALKRYLLDCESMVNIITSDITC